MDLPMLVTFILLCLLSSSKCTEECPKNCVCKHSTHREGPDWIKVRCGDTVPVSYLEELDLLNIASEIVQLNLSRNHLTTFTPKIQFLALQKLDLSKNRLTALYNNQFIEVPNLRRLDISGNNINHIELLAFATLNQLERIKLNQNYINTIEKGTFKFLEALKQLDISDNPLTCNCELLWLLEWAQKASVKLISNPRCSSPSTFKGIPLRKLQIGIDIHCKSPAGSRELPLLDLVPNHNQVLFEGDSVEISCRTPTIFESFDAADVQNNLYWVWSDLDVTKHFSNVHIENHYSVESGLLSSTLKISSITHNQGGMWNCKLSSNNYSQGVGLIVISEKTKFCSIMKTDNNKGSYIWPQTVVNNTVHLPCNLIQTNREIVQQKASYFCSISGEWKNLNTSLCAYVSEVTKILEQFSKANLTKENAFESIKHLKNYTFNLKTFKDITDLEFIIQTLEKYLNLLPEEKELPSLMMDILNHLLYLSKMYLEESEIVYNTSSKIIDLIETIASYVTVPILHRSNVAVEEFSVKQELFVGLTCTWYTNLFNNTDRLFYCITSNQPVLSGMEDRVVEASIQIPASLFYQLQQQDIVLDHSMQKLLIVMLSNSKLFHLDDIYTDRDLTSGIVGVKLGNLLVTNLTDPIYVMLRTPPKMIFDAISVTPVWWNVHGATGRGNWSSSGCELSHEVQDSIVFHCNQLGYYGLLQNISHSSPVKVGAKFRLSHPAIYVGSLILFLSLFLVILSYCVCYMSIQMPKKAKHSLINMWIAVVLLLFVYVFGIYQTEDVQLCQIIGVILHYLTLCSLFWMCVGLTSMYKRLNRNEITELQDDELPSDQPIQKPILGLYLIGWGIALIVCGISGAVNMKDYAAQTHCFLSSTPSLSALVVPVIVLLLILSALFLLIRCAIYSSDVNGHLSEGTQVTENVDLDMLEPSFPNPDHTSIRSSSTKTRSSEIEDAEHIPSTQLKAYFIFLIIYLLSWFSCALATVKPFAFQYEEDIFSVIYAIFATALGAFTLFFYCVARSDLRTQWLLLRNYFKKRTVCFRSRNISDTAQNLPHIQIQPGCTPTVANADVRATSRSSSRSSSHTKSNSNNSNVLKAAINLNTVNTEEPLGARVNNVNLVVLHRQQYRTNAVIPNLIENPATSAQVFYNPYQSTVARRFFKKQRQHMMKRNNLNMQKCVGQSESTSAVSLKPITDNSSIDQSIFGTNSKVNNTNIHVEHVRKTKQKNLNVLSDSHDEISLNNVPIEKLMMNAERLRKRELNRPRIRKKQNLPNKIENKDHVEENNMRSVSQQCSLDYSSDSTSLLDKSLSFDKTPAIHNSETVSGKNRSRKQQLFKNNKIISPCEEPSDLSLSVIESTFSEFSEPVPKIYVNPTHDFLFPKRVQSRASSVSTSELDELYQQIRRGTESRHKCNDGSHPSRFQNCRLRLSDPEINFSFSDLKNRSHVSFSIDNISDNVETVV
ncbi:hypothetical protein PPYR_05153 [Photinus pyralis]|uniref:G-protein coupled receptors family 2 profile 2 domain-containing protein n=1 Tax=Photinus pyralis TaxID=7054 RepID=A0A1Y1K2Z1_PHOPY|nr:adhesion G protein-coupled receptor A3 [Photinus pyralis]KAB0802967.1 hypothetical protein PPYR_05153 [Photinus pyralis]